MTIEIQACPLCEVGTLNEFLYSETIGIRGEATEVRGLHASRCDTCGEVSTSFSQLKENSRIIAAAKADAVEAARRKQGLLIAEQVRQVREHLGLTQLEAARVFGGGDNIFSKYERGEVKQNKQMDHLLRLSVEVPDAAAWLMQHAGLATKLAHVAEDHLPESRAWWNTSFCLVIDSPQWEEVDVVAHWPGPALRAGPLLEEDLFSSTTWKDVPLQKCAGWN